jgi:tetratricopeptide (TPR) repeat protein
MDPGKGIVLCYTDADRETANQLKDVLEEYLGDVVWTRDFDLDGGDVVIEALECAITEANWFVLILSRDSVRSKWVKHEITLATTRSIEQEGFRIAVVRLDDAPYPPYCNNTLRAQHTIGLANSDDRESRFMELAEYISSFGGTWDKSEVYVDRGEAADRFSLLARRNKIVFVVGWAGQGKTAFVNHSAAEKLRKRALRIHLTRGHSLDWLCGDVLRCCHKPDVRLDGVSKPSDADLLDAAIKAIATRARTHFVFLDDVESVLDPENRLPEFLELFLDRFIGSEIDTRVILATTRNPDYSAFVGVAADTLKLEGLESEYIEESIDLWLDDSDRLDELRESRALAELVTLADGHPMAAKMLASRLRYKDAATLLLEGNRRRFAQALATYILRGIDQSDLDDVQRLVLSVLAIVRSPLSITDLTAINELRNAGVESLADAVSGLADRFLVEQRGELISLHNFILSYYEDKIAGDEVQSTRVAREFCDHSRARLIDLNRELKSSLPDGDIDQETLARISEEMFRYCIPAGRLLRVLGDDEAAEQLPIQVTGMLREMVFCMYQDMKNYARALSYADRWLALNPGDREIMLYKVRCLRNLGGRPELDSARALLEVLESSVTTTRFRARLCRERGIIAERSGDPEGAKGHYRDGIEADSRRPYAENYVGLANILLSECEHQPNSSHRRMALADEALELLTEARRQEANFDTHHLSLYVQALIEADYEQVALPLLEEALEERPADGRLNWRMAEILRKREDFDRADYFAEIAIQNGASDALMTRANILHARGAKLAAIGDIVGEQRAYRDAIEVMRHFTPQTGQAKLVANSTIAKLARAAGDWNAVSRAISAHLNTDDPYMLYEQGKYGLHEAESQIASGNEASAAAGLLKIVAKITDVERSGRIQPNGLRALQEVRHDAESRLAALRERQTQADANNES